MSFRSRLERALYERPRAAAQADWTRAGPSHRAGLCRPRRAKGAGGCGCVHRPASLYERFAPAEGLSLHYARMHASWLNTAEIELSVLSRQCLDRRIPDEGMLREEVQAFADARNAAGARIERRFTSQDARIKRHRLYPSVSG